MSAKKSTMQSGTQNAPDTSADAVAKGMAASLKKAILQKGLNRLDEVERSYEGARSIFAACPIWPEVERKCSPILAKARQQQQAQQQAEQEGQREYELKLARIRAHQDNITFVHQPNASTGVDYGSIDQQVVSTGQSPTINYNTPITTSTTH